MLRFTKFQRSRNFILIFFCVISLIGLVILYIPDGDTFSPQRVTNTASDTQVITKVSSYEISTWEYRRSLMELAQMLGRNNPGPLGTFKSLDLDSQALSKLIRDRMLLMEADRDRGIIRPQQNPDINERNKQK